MIHGHDWLVGPAVIQLANMNKRVTWRQLHVIFPRSGGEGSSKGFFCFRSLKVPIVKRVSGNLEDMVMLDFPTDFLFDYRRATQNFWLDQSDKTSDGLPLKRW